MLAIFNQIRLAIPFYNIYVFTIVTIKLSRVHISYICVILILKNWQYIATHAWDVGSFANVLIP